MKNKHSLENVSLFIYNSISTGRDYVNSNKWHTYIAQMKVEQVHSSCPLFNDRLKQYIHLNTICGVLIEVFALLHAFNVLWMLQHFAIKMCHFSSDVFTQMRKTAIHSLPHSRLSEVTGQF